MRAGKLAHRLVYQEATTAPDRYNAPVETWADVGNLWGDVRTPNGRELLAAQAFKSTVTHVIEVRAQTYPIKPTGRILDLDALAGTPGLYQLVAITDPDGRRRRLVLFAVETIAPDATDASNL